MNAGRPLGQLSACFVLPVEDALSNGKNGIYDTLRSMALIHQSGGGTGFCVLAPAPRRARWCARRPASPVGPVSFMKLYDASHRRGEAGRHAPRRQHGHPARRSPRHHGVHHLQGRPHADDELQHLASRVTTKFMEAVKAGTSYDLIDPRHAGKSSASSTRAMVWDKMIARRVAHRRAGRASSSTRPTATTPSRTSAPTRRPTRAASSRCCRTTSATSARINVGLLRERRQDGLGRVPAATSISSTHFLDNIIDVNKYPLPEIDDLSKRIRRIGLGVMGFADALVRLGIAYDTAEGVEFGRKVMEFVDVEAKKESERLADERGPFPEWARVHLGSRRDVRARRRTASASVRCSCCATATSPPSRRPARSRSSPAARRASSRCSPLRSCAIRPA